MLEDYADRLTRRAGAICSAPAASQRMGQLIDGLLSLSHDAQRNTQDVWILLALQMIAGELRKTNPRDRSNGTCARLIVHADASLRIMLQNLLENAWKFTSKHPRAEDRRSAVEQNGETVYFVRDDGAGFDMAYADKLFAAFSRLHAMAEFDGTGIGLATVRRIVHRHGGRYGRREKWSKGATIYFTIPRDLRSSAGDQSANTARRGQPR